LARPTALALDPQSVWVASTEGTVTRIDRGTNSVTSTIDLGGSLAAIVSDGTSTWVGDRDGNIYRLDAGNLSSAPARKSTTSAVASLAMVDGGVWLAANASAASHRGGSLHVVQFRPDELPRYQTDPHANPFYNVTSLEADGLVGLRRVGGSAGATLLPNLATSVPRPTDGGLTYTFQLRPNLVYADGTPVRASDFRRAIERSFQVTGFFDFAYGNFLFRPIVGTDACTNKEQAAVEHCDLHEGVEADDTTNSVTFHLTTSDPDFVTKLAHPMSYPVPDGIPMTEWVGGAFPGTGPYVVTSVTESEVRLGRNPNFTVRDPAVRPDGYADEIVFTVVDSDEQRISMVESGDADYTSFAGLTRTSIEQFARIKTQYPFQWHAGSFSTSYVEMNPTMPPFDDPNVRRAVNFAIDRDHMADLNGGPPDARVTCQLLPPGFPGYEPYCPYTVDPGPGGVWKFADIQAARRLVEASGTRGTKVTVGPTFPGLSNQLDYLASVLDDLGYVVSVKKVDTLKELLATDGMRQISVAQWSPDFVAPSVFLGLYTCGGDAEINHCDPAFDAAFDHALELQQTDPAAAQSAWADLDRRGVDEALVAPIQVAGGHFVSQRVGNFQYSPNDSVLFDQMWVQ
jgi:peptide/nickel transport system substrate-binding protein